MADLVWFFFQTLLIFSKLPRKNSFFTSFALHIILLAPVIAVSDRNAQIELKEWEKYGSRKPSAENDGSNVKTVHGRFAEIGPIKSANGRLHMLPSDCNGDEVKGFARLPHDWIAVLHYAERNPGTADNTSSECPSVIDRMQRALMFGASAIIILALNPKILKELDARQLFSKPVIIVETLENITNFVTALKSKIKWRANVTYSSSFFDFQRFPTLTLWSTCGRSNGRTYHEWDGVVCMGSNQSGGEGKADPSNFWNFFYSCIFSLMMLFVLKARRRFGEWGDEDNQLEALNITKAKHQWVIDHLGHTMNVHQVHYRQKSDVLERIDVAKILLIQYLGLVVKYKGIKLDEINLEEIAENAEQLPAGASGDATEPVFDNSIFRGQYQPEVDEDYIPEVPNEVESDGDDDYDFPATKKKKRRPQDSPTVRQRWTNEEIEELKELYKSDFETNTTPGQKRIETMISKSMKNKGFIYKRKWDTIKKKTE